MSLEEFEDNLDPKTRRQIQMKSIMDLGMGFIYILVGLLLLCAKQIHLSNGFANSTTGKLFGALIILYGLWRGYRGIKKNYLKER
jgi:hypothetical protein